jgi:hypothetical protein
LAAKSSPSPPDHVFFRLQPELHISTCGPAVLLPKFVRPRSDLLLKPPCSKAPLQLLLQFLNKPPKALRCGLVADVGSEPPCSFDLALKVVRIFILIHRAISHPRTRDRSIVEQAADHLAKRLVLWSSVSFVRAVDNKHMVAFTT